MIWAFAATPMQEMAEVALSVAINAAPPMISRVCSLRVFLQRCCPPSVRRSAINAKLRWLCWVMNVIIAIMHDISSSNSPVGGSDPLTRMLQSLRLDGLEYGRRHLSGTWAYSFHEKDNAYFHFIGGAPCWLLVQDREWSELQTGDAILLPRGDAHVLASAPDAVRPPFPPWKCRPIWEDGYDPEAASENREGLLFYGSMRFNLDRSHPLFRCMSPVLHARALIGSESLILPLLNALAAEMVSRRVGAAGMAARLADVLAVQIIRSWMESGTLDDGAWINAARQPQIGQVLAAIHEDPGGDWSVGKLAAIAGMSRSAFATAFASILGDTPARYLTDVRMQQAKQWIMRDNARIAEVAERLRYDSEASFSRAFKRVIGMPPSSYRVGKR
ncbi:AraC family transcriptional regulator [Acetobacter senegalensis]|uniref:AraC family transcriptional regulator n=1 Tax=Acetobacter senegalensis TaxID=446692 RepID=UPI0029C9D3A8|nr:AraC family transcriptional regulator [Acetobacter senegalensis]